MSQQAAYSCDGSEAGDTAHLPTASKSPTASVGAAHGIGSSPIAGPLKAQAQPLQTNPLKLMEENGDPEIPGRTADPPSARDLRASPSSASTVALSPSQQAFVDQLKKKYQNGTSTPHEDSPPYRPYHVYASSRSNAENSSNRRSESHGKERSRPTRNQQKKQSCKSTSTCSSPQSRS